MIIIKINCPSILPIQERLLIIKSKTKGEREVNFIKTEMLNLESISA